MSSDGTNLIGEPVKVLFRSRTLGTVNLFEPRLLAISIIAQPKSSFRIHHKAATRKLEQEAVYDFLRLIDCAEQAVYLRLNPAEKRWIRTKSRLLGVARN